MVSNFQFLAKALRFPATAPTLLALSLTAFAASQVNDRLSSQASQSPSDDDDADNSPEVDAASALSAWPIPPQPEQFPLEGPGVTQDLNFNQASLLPNLEVILPKPVSAPPSSPVNPPAVESPVQVAPVQVAPVQAPPQLVQSVVSHSLAYQTVGAASPIVSSLWPDLQGHWSQPYVEALIDLGILKGLPDGQFQPDRPITRAELADLLQRSLPRPEETIEVTALTDVPNTHWAAASIDRAVRMGFFPDAEATGFFHPDRPASRLVTWGAIVSGLDLPSSKQHNALLQAWEASQSSAVDSAMAPSQTQLSPQLSAQDELNQPVTRAEAVTLLYHALRLTEQGESLAEVPLPQSGSGSRSISASVSASTSASVGSEIDPSLPLAQAPELEAANLERSFPSTPKPSDRVEEPLLIAAQLPLPDPLLSPLPPSSEPSSESAAQNYVSAYSQNVERISPEFGTEPLTLGQLPVGGDLPPSPNSPNLPNLQTVTAANPEAIDETYTLGAGDRIFIEVFGLPEYSQDYQVLVDGSLNLPRAGRMLVEGMTLTQVESLIYSRYARYYQQPATSVVLVQPRSLRISVTGEVNRPGVYRLSATEGSQFPSVTQALQEAGGISQDADLRQVKVYRSQRNGEPQTLTLNLWELLQTGDLSQDMHLRDGDRLVIAKAEDLSIADLNQIATANIAPNAIAVTVVGSGTETQGTLQLSPNTPLNQVVLAAGGFNDRRESRTVNLIRLHPNGTVEQRVLDVPIAADVNEENNPILRNKDVIVLDRSQGTAIREGAFGVLGNILRVIPFVNLFF